MTKNIQEALPSINPGECHVAAVLLVDISKSTEGEANRELNEGLVAFGEALRQDSLAMGRADVCVISFNSTVQTELGFRPASEYEAPVLTASGLTSFNAGINAGLDAIEDRKKEYKETGTRYYRPWLFVLTDGAPTDLDLEDNTRARLQSAIEGKKVTYLPMGIGENADLNKLQSYYPDSAASRPVLKADANHFKEAFSWLSASLSEVTHSNPDAVSEIQTPGLPASITIGI